MLENSDSPVNREDSGHRHHCKVVRTSLIPTLHSVSFLIAFVREKMVIITPTPRRSRHVSNCVRGNFNLLEISLTAFAEFNL